MAPQVSSDASPIRPQLSDVLPLPEPRFKGSIGTSYTDSKADVIALPTAPAGAPNVLLTATSALRAGNSIPAGASQSFRRQTQQEIP